MRAVVRRAAVIAAIDVFRTSKSIEMVAALPSATRKPNTDASAQDGK